MIILIFDVIFHHSQFESLKSRRNLWTKSLSMNLKIVEIDY